MANNELSGPIVSMNLIDYFKKKKNKKTLRFIFIPETIGSIVYLSKNLSKLQNKVCGGYNLTCIGDDRQHSCMLSKYGDSPSDEALIKAYKLNRIKYKKYSFLKEDQMKDNLIHQELIYLSHQFLEQNIMNIQNTILH